MKSTLIFGMALTFVFTSSALAIPTIDVGNHVLQPNQANQPVEIFVTGGDPVQGVNFNVEVGAGGPPIQDLVIFDDAGPKAYIFDNNNNGTLDQDGPHPDAAPLWEGRSTTTVSGSIAADGLLATIFFDTTGISGGGPWPLTLTPSVPPPTDFAGVPADITDGTLRIEGGPVIIPEPATIVVWSLLAAVGIALGCYRRRQK